MTRITVHAAGDHELVVSGDDGRRWLLAGAGADLDAPGLQGVLGELRATAPDVAVTGGHDVEVGSVESLRVFAATCRQPAVVLWRHAGRPHRMRFAPEDAVATAVLVDDVLRAGIADPDLAAALSAEPLLADPLVVRGTEAITAAPATLERWDGEGWRPHPIRPAPVLDAVAGIIRRIVARPVEDWHPAGFRHLHAELPHLGSIDARFQPDPLAPAGAFEEGPDTPLDAAILSGVSHYCGAYLAQGERRQGSARELHESGDRVLTVDDWRPHDPVLHEQAGFPFRRLGDAEQTWWVAGVEQGRRCWVPLSLVHAGYLASALDPLPVTNGHNLVGLQAGLSIADAADRAAAHVIAHDAVARWWREPRRLPAAEPPASLRAAFEASPVSIVLLDVPSATGIPVRLAVVDDARVGVVGLGFAAAADPAAAAFRASAEALVQFASARDLDDPDSLIRAGESRGHGGVAGLAAFDEDRRYDETAFADVRALIDPMGHVQYGLSASSVARVRRRTEPIGVSSATAASVGPLDALRASGTRVITVDVTTDRVREAGYAACRVLATGFDRLTPAAFPTVASDRGIPYPGW